MDSDTESVPESIYEEPADNSDADADYVPQEEEDAQAEIDGDFEYEIASPSTF